MNPFAGKKITVMGLGLLGRGVNDAKYLAKMGAELIVTDLKTKEQLESSLDQLSDFSSITYRLGEHVLEDFEDRDFILKAAGVPLDSPYIEHAQQKDIPIKMDESWFAELAPEGVTIIGITGTRGKTTTSHLIYEILKAAGLTAYLGGNIRDTATLPLLDTVKPGDVVVMELSSWQLQGFEESKISPHIAVFTNFMDDHMNYYRDNRFLYFKDKAQIFLNQTSVDYLITGSAIPNHIRECNFHPKGQHQIVSPDNVPSDWSLKIRGMHNKENIACALAVANILDIDNGISRRAVEAFSGIEGRLEYVREYKDIKIYNDNNATTQEATLVALEALKDEGLITLIMGGAYKELSITKLLEVLPERVEHLILLPGSGTDKIEAEIKRLFPKAMFIHTMQEAVDEAINTTSSGGVILLSPAFASFGLFKNEYDRNDQFVNAINALG